jgi:hypothetical protein
MSEYRKIHYPSCPYCQSKVKEDLFDYNYGELVSMVAGRARDVVLRCGNCGKRYRVTCSIKFYSRRIKDENSD